jgi:RNA polymerase sigma-70 factor (ECF subfamily)
MSNNTHISSTPFGGGRFATTHWSVVLAAGRSSLPQYDLALSTSCQRYWFSLYAYLSQHVYDAHQTADYTQIFFAQMLEKHYLHKVESKSGKFRSFLLAALRNFVADEYDTRQRRSRSTLCLVNREANRKSIVNTN